MLLVSWLIRKGVRTAILIACILTVTYFGLQFNILNKEKASTEQRHFESRVKSNNSSFVFDKLLKNKIAVVSTNRPLSTVLNTQSLNDVDAVPCPQAHIFYYPWYGNPKVDGKYLHWNHPYLPHWSPEVAKIYKSGRHEPPDDLGSNFYPALGPYSSQDPFVIQEHMRQIRSTNIGVLAVSYYPQGLGDDNGEDWQLIFPMLFDAANKAGLKVTFHIEPYKHRTQITARDDIRHIIDTYGAHPAFYRINRNGKLLPLIYMYDSYHTKPEKWRELLSETGALSLRGTPYDCVLIGLLVERNHPNDILRAGFDGFYTYFASNGFTYGSSRQNWPQLKDFANRNKLLFIPSVGPGYIDTQVRPWNAENTRKRLRGKYYSDSWTTALSVHPDIVSVTSFNEWHEGTQIERAVPKTFKDFTYLDYSPSQPDMYLLLTKKFVERFPKCDRTSE